jgi:hypothetical protein
VQGRFEPIIWTVQASARTRALAQLEPARAGQPLITQVHDRP